MKKLLQRQLKLLAKLVIKKYHPIVIGITGSVGKTSAKDAIAYILNNKFKVRTSYKNYNNEIGLPLTIIGAVSPGRSIFAWLRVFIKASFLIITSVKYPKILVLEMGVDRPGDMKYLLSIVSVKIAVVTDIGHSHLEFFNSIENIKKEKQVLIENIDNKGLAIINYDNKYSKGMIDLSKANVVTFGFQEGADIKAQDISYNYKGGNYELNGLRFKLNNKGSIVPVYMKNVLSKPAIYSALIGAATALYFDMNLVEVANILENFSLPAGRMNYIPGVNNTFIIDDSYNSSPESASTAIETLDEIRIDADAKKYAILGDMLEIGKYTEEGHKLMGKKIAESSIDYLIVVGNKSVEIAKGAIAHKMSQDSIFHFNSSEEAARFIKHRIEAGDLILVKGSQKIRMEKIVEQIMAEPNRAKELLVRQGGEWK